MITKLRLVTDEETDSSRGLEFDNVVNEEFERPTGGSRLKLAASTLGAIGLTCLMGIWYLDATIKNERHMSLPEEVRKYDIDRNGYMDPREMRVLLDSYKK